MQTHKQWAWQEVPLSAMNKQPPHRKKAGREDKAGMCVCMGVCAPLRTHFRMKTDYMSVAQ